MRTLSVLATGPLTTVQDLGRPGLAHLGIGRSGACDRASLRLANRLVGNDEGAAALEVTLGGLALRAGDHVVLAVTGARCGGVPLDAPFDVGPGGEVRLGPAAAGLRGYVAVRGGIAVPAVLGSRASDLLGGIGPPALRAGDVLPVGAPQHPMPGVDVAPLAGPAAGDLVVPVLPGPRRDWFAGRAWRTLLDARWTVGTDSDRAGARLEGPALTRRRHDELPSEGMLRGALQVPPSGRPVLFLADHPVTGGYPVIGYVEDAAVDACGQLRPGQALRLRPAR